MTGIYFIQDLAVVMLVAGLAGWLFQRVGLSAIVGYLLAGMVIGPQSGLFPLIEKTENIQILSQVGLVFLMFAIGMGLSLRRLRRLGLSVLLATAVGALLVFNGTRAIAVATGWSEVESLFLAAMLVVSSSAIIGKALHDLGVTHQKSSQLALGVTVLEDMVAIVVLTLLISYIGMGERAAAPIVETLGIFGAFVIFLGVSGLLLVPRFLRLVSAKASGELLTLLVAALLFLLALLAYHAGYSLALGAFLLGAIVAETPQRGQVDRNFEGLRHLFSTVFFVSIGMMIDFRSLLDMWGMILLISGLTILGRTAACTISLLLIGNTTREAVRAGLALSPVGEFSFIIAQTGVMALVLSPEFYPLAVGVSVVTTFFCPLLIRYSAGISLLVEKVEPSVVKKGLAFYHRWLDRLARIGKESMLWRLSRRRLIQIGVGVLFITGLLIVGNPVYSRIVAKAGPDWLMPYGTIIIFWFILGLVVLIPLVAIWRNIAALAMLYAQMTSHGRERETIVPFLIENGIKGAAGALLFIWLWGFLPLGTAAFWVLLVVVGVAALILVFFRRRIVHIHSRLEVELEELLATERRGAGKALPPWLSKYRDWELNVSDFELPDGAACAGKRIGEIHLRSRFGCSIMGVDRQGFFIGNPGPDTVLFPRDRLLLLGGSGENAAARQFLGITRKKPEETIGLDEVQMESITVPATSPRLGQALTELNIARETGVQIAAIKRNGVPHLNPGGDERLEAENELLVMGTPDQVRRFQRWLVAEEPAMELE